MLTHSDFLKFHSRNPHIWRAFCRMALQAIKKNGKVSAVEIFGKLRRSKRIITNTMRAPGMKKLDNNIMKYYSAYFNDLYPEHNNPFRVARKTMESIKTHQTG